MMRADYDKNVFYVPEVSGLTILGSLSEPELSYEFNDFVVWLHSDSGRVFFAQDSGCSCPTPFQDYHFNGPDDTNLTEVTLGDSFRSFKAEVKSFCACEGPYDEASHRVPMDEKEKLIDLVKAKLGSRAGGVLA